jgi:hypothetical protein
MDKKARLKKLHSVYTRVQAWIHDNQGKVSPSDINIAMTVLRELEELTVYVDGQAQSFTKPQMRRLNELWRKYQ